VSPEGTQAFAEALGLLVEAEAWARLHRLVELWSRYGRAMNLTGDPRPSSLWRHVEDGFATIACASALGPVSGATAWVDVGSGGGFPGLVVAAVTPCALTLIEPRQRRASFLELALQDLARSDAVVRRARVDGSTWTKDLLEALYGWDKSTNRVLTARAVWSPAEWLELGMTALLNRSGAVLAHLGADAKPPKPPDAQTASPLGTVCGWRSRPTDP
jgi:16S rRNA (guanine527-N7)-methyltransferase